MNGTPSRACEDADREPTAAAVLPAQVTAQRAWRDHLLLGIACNSHVLIGLLFAFAYVSFVPLIHIVEHPLAAVPYAPDSAIRTMDEFALRMKWGMAACLLTFCVVVLDIIVVLYIARFGRVIPRIRTYFLTSILVYLLGVFCITRFSFLNGGGLTDDVIDRILIGIGIDVRTRIDLLNAAVASSMLLLTLAITIAQYRVMGDRIADAGERKAFLTFTKVLFHGIVITMIVGVVEISSLAHWPQALIANQVERPHHHAPGGTVAVIGSTALAVEQGVSAKENRDQDGPTDAVATYSHLADSYTLMAATCFTLLIVAFFGNLFYRLSVERDYAFNLADKDEFGIYIAILSPVLVAIIKGATGF